MKQKKIPLRTCVITREKCEKKDLIRVVKNNKDEEKAMVATVFDLVLHILNKTDWHKLNELLF